MKITNLAVAALLGLVRAKEIVLTPDESSSASNEVAVVWLHGMECKPEAYQTIA